MAWINTCRGQGVPDVMENNWRGSWKTRSYGFVITSSTCALTELWEVSEDQTRASAQPMRHLWITAKHHTTYIGFLTPKNMQTYDISKCSLRTHLLTYSAMIPWQETRNSSLQSQGLKMGKATGDVTMTASIFVKSQWSKTTAFSYFPNLYTLVIWQLVKCQHWLSKQCSIFKFRSTVF